MAVGGLARCLKGVKMKNVFYFKSINSCGGVESWFYYLSKIYKNMTVYYKEADPLQIERLAKNIEVKKYTPGEIIKCDNFFCSYSPDIVHNVIAKHKKHIVHCDYSYVNFPPLVDDAFDGYIGVSQLACDSFTKLTGKECELIYNPIKIEVPNVKKYNDRKLHLISATRLTNEKGLKRMQKLAKMLEDNKIDYEWIVYTNRKREAVGKNVIYKDVKLDILEEIAKADYLVQLSDCEAYCYSVVEALMVGTPVIVTDLPVFHEIGLKHKKNAFLCDLSMTNINIQEIVKKPLKFKYTPPKSNWNKYLDNKTKYNPDKKIKVRVIKKYKDLVMNKLLEKNDIEEMNISRVSYLECKGLVEKI